MTAPAITPELLARYDRPGPRYTSYPTVPEWSADFGAEQYQAALAEAAAVPDAPLSLYVHSPFCPHRCAYCGCTTITAPGESLAAQYLEDVTQEIDRVAALLGARKSVSQCHWGGGTPTYLNEDQMRRLFYTLAGHFSFDADAEIAIETNPNAVTRKQLDLLRGLGFNRISFGVGPRPGRATGGRPNQTVEKTEEIPGIAAVWDSAASTWIYLRVALQQMEPTDHKNIAACGPTASPFTVTRTCRRASPTNRHWTHCSAGTVENMPCCRRPQPSDRVGYRPITRPFRFRKMNWPAPRQAHPA